MMFASVHLACKIEEVHEITLDKLLESTGFGTDPAMPLKIAALELPLLEGIGFALLVEPKPDSTLRMLVEDLRRHLGPAQASQVLTQASCDELVQAAEDLTLNLSIRTDAVLRWPLSVVVAAALQAKLEEAATRGLAGGTELIEALYQVLDAGLEAEEQRSALRTMMKEA